MAESLSNPVVGTAPGLVGVWVFDPTDPDGTVRNYLHADGRSASTVPAATVMQVAGRANPVVEFGEATAYGVDLSVLAPFGPQHDADVQWWRVAVANRRAICYRDNRGRLLYAVLPGGISEADVREGTRLAIKLRRIDYTVGG